MSKIILIALFLFIANISFSQHSQKGFQVKGRVLDHANGSPIGYANAALYAKPGDKLISGQMTKENGEFQFNEIPSGSYYLKITFVGFREYTKDSINLNSSNPTVSLGDIDMQTEAKLLNEVYIVGEPLKGEAMVDKTVYNINPSIAKTSNTGMELLKRIPTLQVDMDNNISLEGSGNILIYVDGKEMNKEYIYSLNPQLIDKIEVINNPSSKYDAAVTGVINIILKHQSIQGGVLSISTEIPVSKTYGSDHSLSLTYNYKKFTMELNVFGDLSKWDDDRYITRKTLLPDTTSMIQKGKEHPSYNGIEPSLTLGYFFNKKNALHFYIQDVNRYYHKKQEMERDEDSIGYVSDKRFKWNYHNNLYSLFYKKTFNRPETELTADVSYSEWNDKGVDYNKDLLLTDLALSEVREFTTKNHEQVYFGKLDFSTKVSDNIKLETGYAFSDQKLSNNLNGNTIQFDDNIVFSYDSLKYDEKRNAGYLSFSGSINKFNWMAGLRLENSEILINKSINAGYTCLLPNISFQQKLNGKNSLKLTYRRRIIRPQSQHLNPFLKQNEKMTYEQGDPNIKPSYVNSFKFSLNYAFGNSMIIPQLFFNYNQNNINRIGTMSSEGILTKSYKNGGNSYDYGAELSGQLQLFKWWTLNPYLSLGEAHILGLKTDKFNIEEQSDLKWNVNISSVMTFRNDLNFVIDFNYRSPFLSPQTRTYQDIYYSVKIEKGLFKQKAKIGINVFTPFSTHFVASRQVVNSQDQYQNFTQTDQIKIVYNYRILLVFTYNLKWGEMANKININRTDINEGRGGGF